MKLLEAVCDCRKDHRRLPFFSIACKIQQRDKFCSNSTQIEKLVTVHHCVIVILYHEAGLLSLLGNVVGQGRDKQSSTHKVLSTRDPSNVKGAG